MDFLVDFEWLRMTFYFDRLLNWIKYKFLKKSCLYSDKIEIEEGQKLKYSYKKNI